MLDPDCSITPDDWPHGYGFCWCGCGEKTELAKRNFHAKGRKLGDPARFVHGHNRRKSPIEYIADPETGCWVWQKATSNGYGMMYHEGRLSWAYAVYFKRARGPVPAGLTLDHLCRNPRCVNPEHLDPVTHQVNVLRGVGPTAINARKTHCIRGHEFTPQNTSIPKSGARVCRKCRCIRQREKRQRARDMRHHSATMVQQISGVSGHL